MNSNENVEIANALNFIPEDAIGDIRDIADENKGEVHQKPTTHGVEEAIGNEFIVENKNIDKSIPFAERGDVQ